MPTPQASGGLLALRAHGGAPGLLILSAGALQVGGQMLGGKGRFAEALMLVVWLEVLAIVIQAATLLVALALPPLAGLLGGPGPRRPHLVRRPLRPRAARFPGLWPHDRGAAAGGAWWW
jgi:hypothetical protein